MNRENLEFLYKMFPCHNIENLDIIIVNQTDKAHILTSNISTVKVVNSFEKGLSKSRNLALSIAQANWCLIADDDLVYVEGFEQVIAEGIEKYTQSGVIVFKSLVQKSMPRRLFPKTSKQQLTVFEKFDVTSFEMLLNRTTKKNLLFNENFGLGSNEFLFGEEVLLLHDYIKHQMKVSYYNKAIVYHPIENTGTLYNHDLRYYTKGGILKYIYPKTTKLWLLIQLFFDVKQKKIQFSSIYKSYYDGIRGAKKLNEILKNATH
ncbi:MAG: glycosyltransferase [Flavobacteriaceae bacterium]